MAQILIIAPFRELADETKQVIKERFNDDNTLFKVLEADLKEAEKLIGSGIERDVDVIVSRGGTAKLLEKNTDFPIVQIQVSLADILRVIRSVQNKYNKVGIAGFENILYGCQDITKLFNIEVEQLLVYDEESADEKLLLAKQQGIDLIVGDAISVKKARQMDIAARIIDSGKQAIYQSLLEAVVIAKVKRQEKYKSEALRTVVNHSDDGIIVINESGIITSFNRVAELIFHKVNYEAIGKPFTSICSVINENRLQEEADVIEIFGKKYLVKSSKVNVRRHQAAVIYSLKNINEVQRVEWNIRKKLSEKGLIAKYSIDDIIGNSEACCKMKNKAQKYAITDSTILITGESGTGKELIAQSIHNMSRRSTGPFVAVNCAAIPENLLESELFGYVDGAFTGAKKGGRRGMFELAHGGTLFLDEIGEMPISLQSRLLRVLQEREVMPLGGEHVIPINVRIVAATNQNLPQMVKQGKFRNDLYYRLNILHIRMPNLSERSTDIPDLAKHFLEKMNHINPQVTSISNEAVNLLSQKEWPGNIRQFVNVMERLLLLCEGNIIDKHAIYNAYEDDQETTDKNSSSNEHETPDIVCNTKMNLKDITIETIEKVLQEEGNNYSKAAQRLGIHSTTIWRKLKK